ncbi:MAG: hypothetical protein GTO02_11665, partial [Candidatus Dadabacteria bacterium]|nr:hypothetical protein [Candidatus Dadabacteria bacterium]
LKMRRGKEIAQGSHASMAFMIDRVLRHSHDGIVTYLDELAEQWLSSGQTKVCLQIHSEKEMMEIF